MRLFPLVCFLLFASAQATQYPLTVTDNLGRTVVIKSEPKRIIAMLPSHTETLLALGAGDKLIAIDRYSTYPKAVTDKIPKVGSAYQPDLEKILALKPDLILADESASSRLVEKLANLGLTVYGGAGRSYNEVFEKISVVGKMINKEQAATRLVTNMRRDLSALEKQVAGLPKRSVYLELDAGPYSVGPDSFTGVLIRRAGGQTIIPAALGNFPKIDPELIVKANPQVIIGVSLDEAQKRPGWNDLRAVKTQQVYLPVGEERDVLRRPGPRMVDALRELIRWIHPEVAR